MTKLFLTTLAALVLATAAPCAAGVPNPLNAPATSTAGHILCPVANNSPQTADCGAPLAGAQFTVASVSAFQSTNLSAFTKVTTDGYYTPGDGMGGVYSKTSTTCGADDGGYCLHSSDGSFWTLDGFKQRPSLLNYGCRSTDVDCLSKVNALVTAAQAVGANTLYQDVKQIHVNGIFNVPVGMIWDCNGTGQVQNGSASWATLPGAIYTNPGLPGFSTGYLVEAHAQAKVRGCYVLNTNITGVSNDFRVLKNAVDKFNGTGVLLSGRGAGLENSMVVGFAQPYDNENAAGSYTCNVQVDGYNGFLWNSLGDVPKNCALMASNYLTKQFSNNELTYTVTALASDGANHWEATLSSDSVAVTGDTVFIPNTGTNASGRGHTATVVNAHTLILSDTLFGGMTAATVAPTENGYPVVQLSTTTGAETGMNYTDTSGCIPGGTTVLNVSHLSEGGGGFVQLSAAPTCAYAAGATATLTNPTPTLPATLYMTVTTRGGEAFKITNTSGFECDQCFAFGYRVKRHFGVGAFNGRFVQGGGDYNKELGDGSVIGTEWTDDARGSGLTATNENGSGIAFLQTSTNSNPNYVTNPSMGRNLDPGTISAFDIESGNFQLTAPRGAAQGVSYIASAASVWCNGGNIIGQVVLLQAQADYVHNYNDSCVVDPATSGGFQPTTVSVTTRGDGPFTIAPTDRSIFLNATISLNRTWTMPAANAVRAGTEILFADTVGGIGAHTLTLQTGVARDTFSVPGSGAATTYVLAKAYSQVRLRSDGLTQWVVVNSICANLSDAGTACAAGTGTSGHTLGYLDGTNTYSGVQTFGDSDLAVAGATSGVGTIKAPAIAAGVVSTLPNGTQTLMGRSSTDTMTGKTFDTAGAGNSLKVNGLAATDNTGTGKVVRDTAPALITPDLGTPSALNASNATNLPAANLTGTINGARLPASDAVTLGAVNSKSCSASQWFNALVTGVFACAQPAASDISGLAAIATSGSASDLGSGTIPALRLPPSGAATLGAVNSKTCSGTQFMNVLSALGTFTCNTTTSRAPIGSSTITTTVPGTAVISALPTFTSGNPSLADVTVKGYAPITGHILNLSVRFATAPATGHFADITLMQNAGGGGGGLSPTALTCRISDTATSCTDLTHSVAVTIGDFLDWNVTYDGAAATGSRVYLAAEYDTP